MLVKTKADPQDKADPQHYLKCRGVWSVAINTRVKMPASTIAYVDATIAYIVGETGFGYQSSANSYGNT